MILTKVQNRFINNKTAGLSLLKGKKSTGKTTASINRAINLENNYCLFNEDKVLYITNNKVETEKIYKELRSKSNFYSLFSTEKSRIEFSSLAEIINMYAKGYYNGRNLKEISNEKAFKVLENESFNDLLLEYSKKSKLISKMSKDEIFNEILWIKACGFSIDEYQVAVRKGRKRVIRKSSYSRRYLYSLMEMYSAELSDLGYKDKYDDVLAARAYLKKHNDKYSHIIADGIECYTRAEIEFIKELCGKKQYSSIVFVIGEDLYDNENKWLVKGRRLKDLGESSKGNIYTLKTVFQEKKIDINELTSYKFLNLKYKNVVEFKVDNTSTDKEVYLDNEDTYKGNKLQELPVFNEIAAGNPIEINDERQESFYLPKEWISKNSENFILKIKGDSMIGKDINDGDFVVIKRQNTAYQNDIVAMNINGEATLKVLKYEGNEPVLMPANPIYKPITLKGKDAEILGIAVGVIKKK